MRITKEDSVGLIVDIQEKLFVHISEKDELLKNTDKLIKGLKELSVPIIVTQQYTKGLGDTIFQLAPLVTEEGFIEKITFSCCDEPVFIDKIHSFNKKNIIIAGIETHVCVLQTAIDLLSQGYLPVIVENCISSRKLNDKKIALERLKQEGAIVTTLESVLFELCRMAGTEQFKAISKLVK